MKLPKAEEQLMQHLWKREKAFMKDLLEAYQEPKPATTTVATLLKRLINKGYIKYTLYGKSRQYYPMVDQKDYSSSQVNGLISTFFNDSATQFASFFTQETKLSKTELQELRKLIDQEIKKK